MDERILKTLLKKATGYSKDEVQIEYSVGDDGEEKMSKRKVTKKYYPPDGAALKTYVDLNRGKSVEEFTDEELECEKKRLLKELEV